MGFQWFLLVHGGLPTKTTLYVLFTENQSEEIQETLSV
jgi:hypothetical protein